MKTWLITGCSSGLGKRLAAAVASRGGRRGAPARAPSTLAALAARHPATGPTATPQPPWPWPKRSSAAWTSS